MQKRRRRYRAAILFVSMHVLLVEDHEDTRVVLSRLLMHCGHNVAMAENFENACQLLRDIKFDVLVSDLGLPDRDGLDLVGEAKKLQSIGMKIALTARSSSQDRERARSAGFDHFLTKPFDFHKLRALLGTPAVGETM
jgi:DNA-binding response OmpR family regulator